MLQPRQLRISLTGGPERHSYKRFSDNWRVYDRPRRRRLGKLTFKIEK